MILKIVVPKTENVETTLDQPAIKYRYIIGTSWRKLSTLFFKKKSLPFLFYNFLYPLITPTPKLRPFVIPSLPLSPLFLIALPSTFFFRKRCYVPNNSWIVQLLNQSKGNMVELTSPSPYIIWRRNYMAVEESVWSDVPQSINQSINQSRKYVEVFKNLEGTTKS